MNPNSDFLSSFSLWYENHQEEILSDFFTLLRFRSISADPNCKSEVKKTADWLTAYLQKNGFQAHTIATCNQPLVFAERTPSTQPIKTLIFYGHFDVQPDDPIELWESPPFEPTIRDHTVYARGALDNKGQMFYTLTALIAFTKAYPDAPLHLKLILEGEEESGGHGTEEALKKYKDRFKADELYVVDFDIKGINSPTLILGTRGILAMEASLKNGSRDLHSGSHGGIALNPLRALCDIVSSFWAPSKRVAIDGFYEGIESISPAMKAQLDFSFDEKAYQEDFQVKAFAMEEGYSALESNWLRPTLEINGLQGGYAKEGLKTVLPKEAILKLSCRLVPGQDPEGIAKKIEQHMRKRVPSGMELRFSVLHFAKAFRTDSAYPCIAKAKEAYEAVFSKPLAYVLCGASVPILPLLQEATGAQTCLLGMGLETDNIHAPNEHFGLGRFFKGFLIIGHLLYKSAYGA